MLQTPPNRRWKLPPYFTTPRPAPIVSKRGKPSLLGV